MFQNTSIAKSWLYIVAAALISYNTRQAIETIMVQSFTDCGNVIAAEPTVLIYHCGS